MACALATLGMMTVAGCRASGTAAARSGGTHAQPYIRSVACIYDQRPWLNLDVDGDRDPEGIRYRVFLDPGTGQGVHVDHGYISVLMYRLERQRDGSTKRTLASDWRYTPADIHTIHSRMLGHGYFLYLRWHSKDIAGAEIELVTQFENPTGETVRAGTKRLRVPKYTS